VPIEYSGEEQAIVAVGLARPRPGVFVEAIQHLLVLCTTTEVGRGGLGQGGCMGSADGCECVFAGVCGCVIQQVLVLCTSTEVGGQGWGAAWRWDSACFSLCWTNVVQ